MHVWVALIKWVHGNWQKKKLHGQGKPCIPKALRWKLYPQGRSTCPNCNRQTSFMRHLFHLARDSVNTVVCYYRLVTFPSFLNYYFFVFIFIAVSNGGYSFHSVWFSCNDFFFYSHVVFFSISVSFSLCVTTTCVGMTFKSFKKDSCISIFIH